jgi:hypothetical protein
MRKRSDEGRFFLYTKTPLNIQRGLILLFFFFVKAKQVTINDLV